MAGSRENSDNELIASATADMVVTLPVRRSLAAAALRRGELGARHNAAVLGMLNQSMENCVVVNRVLRTVVTSFVPEASSLLPEEQSREGGSSDASALNLVQSETFVILKALLVGLAQRQEEYEEALWTLETSGHGEEEEEQAGDAESKSVLERTVEELAAVLESLPVVGETHVVAPSGRMSSVNPSFVPRGRTREQFLDGDTQGVGTEGEDSSSWETAEGEDVSYAGQSKESDSES